MLRNMFTTALMLAGAAGAAATPEPSAEAKRDLWCMAAFATAAQHAESIGDKAGTEALNPLIASLGEKSAAKLDAEGFPKARQTELAREYVDKALNDQKDGVFSYTQEECLAAAKG